MTTPSGCAKSLSYVVTQNNNSALPSVITYASSNISIYSNSFFTPAATYTIKVIATDSLNGLTKTDTFDVIVLCFDTFSLNKANIPATTTYLIQQTLTTTSLGMSTYNISPAGCAARLTYTVYDISDNGCRPWITCSPSAAGPVTVGTID